MPTTKRVIVGAAIAAAIALPSGVSAAQPVGGLQEVPLNDLLSDYGSVCSSRPTILVKNFGPKDSPVAYLNAASTCGSRVVVYFSNTISAGHVHPERVTADVASIKRHPALYGYLSVKEPSLVGVSVSEAGSLYSAYKRADPSHPVIALLTGLTHVQPVRADITMFDWYPVGRRGYRAGCATLASATRIAATRVWVMVQAHRYDAGGKVQPTAVQMQRQISEAVTCAGAQAVVAHIWRHAAYQADLRRNPSLFRTFLRWTC